MSCVESFHLVHFLDISTRFLPTRPRTRSEVDHHLGLLLLARTIVPVLAQFLGLVHKIRL